MSNEIIQMLFESGSTVVFAAVVWWELHSLRVELAPTLAEISTRLGALEAEKHAES